MLFSFLVKIGAGVLALAVIAWGTLSPVSRSQVSTSVGEGAAIEKSARFDRSGISAPARPGFVPKVGTGNQRTAPRLVAFHSDRDGPGDSFVMNPDGSGVLWLPDYRDFDFGPVWSPNGKRIAFNKYFSQSENNDLYAMNSDGSGLPRLTDHPAFDEDPTWSLDSKHIAVSSDRDFQIHSVNVDWSGESWLTHDSLPKSNPTWSPDGRHIAFIGFPNYRFGAWVMDSDGSGSTRLADHSGLDACLSWSPDATRIAFSKIMGGNSEIHMVNVDGTGEMRLTHNPSEDICPSWSPDGERLAFVSRGDGYSEIYTVKPDGSGASKLTETSAFIDCLSWAPNGRHLAFDKYLEGSPDIFVIGAEGSDERRLTHRNGYNDCPEWSPAGVGTTTLSPVATPVPKHPPVFVASTPAPTRTPIPIRVPTRRISNPTLPPGSVPLQVSFHSDSTDIKTRQSANLSLSVGNINSDGLVVARAVIQAPPGLLLSGGHCASAGQCSRVFELGTGDSQAFVVTATGNQSGNYAVEAIVTWETRAGPGSPINERLDLNVIDPVAGEPAVNLHATKTQVMVGEPVRVNLAVTNSIAQPPMTLTLRLTPPAGWSVSSTGSAEACGVPCNARYTVNSGDTRNITVDMVPNQPGSFLVEAKLEWWYGDDKSTLVSLEPQKLAITVIAPATPIRESAPSETADNRVQRTFSFEPNWLMILWIASGLVGVLILAWLGREVYKSL